MTFVAQGQAMEKQRTEALMEQAAASQAAGDLAQAQRLYQAVLGAQPDHPDALHQSGIIALSLGQPALAEKFIVAGLQRRPGDADMLNHCGVSIQLQNRPSEAVVWYMRATAVRASFPSAHANLATSLSRLGRLTEAIHHYELALPDHDDPAAILAALGECHLANGNDPEGLAAFDKALEIAPGNAAARLGKARELLGNGYAMSAAALLTPLAQDEKIGRDAAALLRPVRTFFGLTHAPSEWLAGVPDGRVQSLGDLSLLLERVAGLDSLEAAGALWEQAAGGIRAAAPNARHQVVAAFGYRTFALLATRPVQAFPLSLIALATEVRLVAQAEGILQRELENMVVPVLERLSAWEKPNTREILETSELVAAWQGMPRYVNVIRLFAETVLQGEAEALPAFLERLLRGPLVFPSWIPPRRVGANLTSSGHFTRATDAALTRIANAILPRLPTLETAELTALCQVLGFNYETPYAHAERLFRLVFARALPALYRLGRLQQADTVSQWVLYGFALKATREEEYERAVLSFAREAASQGAQFGAELASLEPAPQRAARGKRPAKVAFINRGNSINVGAFNHLLPICRHLSQQHGGEFQPYLVITQFYDHELAARAQEAGASVLFLGDKGASADATVARYVELFRELRRQEFDVAVWTHVPDSMFLVFGMRVAPVQVFFSQYLHPRVSDVPGVDATITYGNPGRSFQDFGTGPWRVVPSCSREILAVPLDETVAAVRARFGSDRPLLGSLARAEKLAAPEYLECVCRILERNPNAVFVWTGHSELDTVTDYFARRGLAERAHFVGWVDTLAYAHALDVLLDSFPLCNGVTALQAMAAGTPVVSMDLPTSFLGRDIGPLLRPGHGEHEASNAMTGLIAELRAAHQRGELPLAANADQYVELASELVRSAQKRATAGALMQTIAARLYADEDLMGEAFYRHLREIVDLRAGDPALEADVSHLSYARRAASDSSRFGVGR